MWWMSRPEARLPTEPCWSPVSSTTSSPESKKTLGDLGVRLHHLATWWDVLAVVKKGGYLQASQIAEVEKFLHEPAKWSAALGGVSSFPSGS